MIEKNKKISINSIKDIEKKILKKKDNTMKKGTEDMQKSESKTNKGIVLLHNFSSLHLPNQPKYDKILSGK